MKFKSAVSWAVGLAALFFVTQAHALSTADVTVNGQKADEILPLTLNKTNPAGIAAGLNASDWVGPGDNAFVLLGTMGANGKFTIGPDMEIPFTASLTFDTSGQYKDKTVGVLTLSWTGEPLSLSADLAVVLSGGGTYVAYLFDDVTLVSAGDKVSWQITFINQNNSNIPGLGDINLFIRDITPDKRLNEVPEPATMLLFGTGLLGLAGVARRKKS